MLRRKLNKFVLCLIMSLVLTSASLVATVSAAVTQPLWGDLNVDGNTDSLDLVEFRMVMLGLKAPNPLADFDLNDDGEISALDYAVLKRALINL